MFEVNLLIYNGAVTCAVTVVLVYTASLLQVQDACECLHMAGHTAQLSRLISPDYDSFD